MIDEITKFNEEISRQRRSSTVIVFGLLLCGFIASTPMFNDSIKHEETLYCVTKDGNCEGVSIKRGISFLVDRERRNQLFDNNIYVKKILEPEDSTAHVWGIIGSVLLLLAYGISKNLTNNQEKAVHSQFKLLKIKALEADLLEQTHLDLFEFSKQNQAEVTKTAIARQTSETLQAMKSEPEIQLDHLNGQLQGEISLKSHELQIAELSKQIAESLLAEAEAKQKIEKLKDTKSDSKTNTKPESNKLKLESKYQWIYKLLKLPFRILSGEQGSGKSTLERLMIRLLKDEGWHVVIINPETNPTVWSGVQVLADVDKINDFFEEFPKSISKRQQECRAIGLDEDDYLDHIKNKQGLNGKVAVFLMESNTYEVHGVNPEIWANFLKQSLTNIRKWGYTVCLTAHSDNQTSISSQLAGFSKNIDAAPRVDCIAIAGENGEATSSGKAMLRMKGIKDKEPIEVDLYNYPKSKNFEDNEDVANNSDSKDWHEDLILWAQSLSRIPTPDEIKIKWQELMGRVPTSKQVELLHEYLQGL